MSLHTSNNATPALAALLVIMACGCTTKPLSQQALGREFPVAANATGVEVAQIEFSADPKYETTRGVALAGDPLVCRRDGVFRVSAETAITTPSARVAVRAGEEVAVTSVIRWENAGWQKTCWPFVAFTPESGGKYVVVNERIGGKGASALWTGVGRQTCQVSVYKETAYGPIRVDTRKSSVAACQASQE
jgi:hypothetical protein